MDYRHAVGPSEIYDLVAAMTFNLLTCIGLRDHHRLLDIGCGSLRNGRLLIPYLNPGNYFGVEPNEQLLRSGISNEIGNDMVVLKKPTFSCAASLKDFAMPLGIDFAVAQSIFSHCGRDLIEAWLNEVSRHIKPTGILVATFFQGSVDDSVKGWTDGIARHTPSSLEKIAAQFGLHFELLDWLHPRKQTWAAFHKGYDPHVLRNISWNNIVAPSIKDPV